MNRNGQEKKTHSKNLRRIKFLLFRQLENSLIDHHSPTEIRIKVQHC